MERVRFDLRKLVFHVIGIHRTNLLTCGRAEHLDDLDKLINTRLTREQRLPKHQLRHDTACGPNVCRSDQLHAGVAHQQ